MSKLNFPQIGFGTYHLQGDLLKEMIIKAFQIGYRHFDGASYYKNEKELGEVIQSLPRQDIKITSKVWHDQMGYYPVQKSFDRSLNDLKLDYIDLFLIHWPHPQALIMESLDALRDLQKKGRLVRYGVSNFTEHHLQDALDADFDIACNQVELHPYFNQQKLLDYCNQKEIQLVAYFPIARGRVLNDPLLVSLGQKYGKSSAQITLRWHIQRGVLPIPKTQHLERLVENFNVFDFQLTENEMTQINQLNKNHRFNNHEWSHFDY